jgi:hypothetical protein
VYKRLGSALVLGLLVAGCCWVLAVASRPTATAAPSTDPNLEQLLKRATVDGKYRMLLAQFKVEKDREQYGDFRDLGVRNQKSYAGHTDLPKGHWVYAAPYMYIWRDLSAEQKPKRGWGPEQATGEPDTNMAGDIVTAWASQTPDGDDEWLTLEYAEPIQPTAVLVYETYNPGALVRVTAFRLDGEEVELWKGQDPTTPDNEMGVSEIPVKAKFKTNRIKLYIDSKSVPGWNEIDAVGLRDKDQKVSWAVAADASSTYAPPFDAVPPVVTTLTAPVNYENRIRRLENEVRELKDMVQDLKRKLKDKDR